MSAVKMTRRDFLRNTSLGALYLAAAPAVLPLLSGCQGIKGGLNQAALLATLNQLLGFRVGGMEKSNQVASRLTTNIAAIGRTREKNQKSDALLERATVASLKVQRRGSSNKAKRKTSVSKNLNYLLAEIFNEADDSRSAMSLSESIIETTLFASRGAHYDDTRQAHQLFRDAQRALKQRNSTVSLSVRLQAKKVRLAEYKALIEEHKQELMVSLQFPEDVAIRGIWLMPDRVG